LNTATQSLGATFRAQKAFLAFCKALGVPKHLQRWKLLPQPIKIRWKRGAAVAAEAPATVDPMHAGMAFGMAHAEAFSTDPKITDPGGWWMAQDPHLRRSWVAAAAAVRGQS